MLVCEDSLCPRKQPDVRGPGLGEAGRYIKTGQPQRGSDKEAQDSPPEEVGGGWWPEQADRPTWLADLARGPHCLNQGMWRIPIGPLRQLCWLHPMAPCYKYKGGGE